MFDFADFKGLLNLVIDVANMTCGCEYDPWHEQKCIKLRAKAAVVIIENQIYKIAGQK